MSQIWTPASAVQEVLDHGILYRFTYQRGKIVDAEIVEIQDGHAAARNWRGLGRIVERVEAERDGDAERDAKLDREANQ